MSDQGETTDTPESALPAAETGTGADLAQHRTPEQEPAYHLRLEREEAALATNALRLLISDEAHEPLIRRIAREVLADVEREPTKGQPLVVPLSPQGMKLTHTAVKLLRDDLRRDQPEDLRILRQILDKLPDEHAIRAITLE